MTLARLPATRARLGIRHWALLALLGSFAAAPRAALAARVAIVDVDEAEVHAGPGKGHKVVEKLGRGTRLPVSNQAVEGFYKARTPSGALGFIATESLIVAPLPATEDASVPAPPAAPSPPVASAPASANEPDPRKRAPRQRIRLRALGGYGFFSVGDVNDLFQAAVLRFGFHYGGEMGFLFTPRLAAVARFESVFKQQSVRSLNTLRIYDLSLSSYPAMAGLELAITNDRRISTHFAILAGLALRTSLASTDTGSVEPNVTEQSAHAFTGVAKLDISYALGTSWSVTGEVGYRYLKTPLVAPSAADAGVSGSEIFKDPTTGAFVPVSLDLSGPFLSAGVAFSF